MTPNELKEKRTKILDDTLNHFNAHNRALDESGSCRYNHVYNGGCAIGRLVSEDLAKTLYGPVYAGPTFNELPDDLQQLGQGFLKLLQLLHDFDDYWNIDENGSLSDKGGTMVYKIREYIENNRND